MNNYDDWKLDTPDNHVQVIGRCPHCDLDVYRQEFSFNVIDEGIFHEECFFESMFEEEEEE